MSCAWVLGNHGLLGSALYRELSLDGCELYAPARRFDWLDLAGTSAQMSAAVKEFGDRVGAGGEWHLYWAAGAASMGSSEADLAPEVHAMSALLGSIESNDILMGSPGTIAFASSAGALYAGSSLEIVTEQAPTAPTTHYANSKLVQEEMLRRFAETHGGCSLLLARISTIYGPGQARAKKQGLISHIARCVVRNLPVQIYVPFDTIRDYIAVDDAARSITWNARSLRSRAETVTKIIASEKPTTIAEIVSIFRRISRRAPMIVTSASPLSAAYPRRARFQSLAMPEVRARAEISLSVGIAQVLAAERRAYARSAPARQAFE